MPVTSPVHVPLDALHRLVTLVALVVPLSVAPASAQGQGGSSSGVSVAHGLSGAAGSAQSSNFTLHFGVSQPTAAATPASSSFQLAGGVTSVPAAVSSDAPLVFGAEGGAGEADGSDLVTLYGFNLTAPGAGANAVDFAGSPASGTVTVSNTELRTLTPPGVDTNDNPLAFVDVGVTNALGTHNAGQAFAYQPALTSPDFTRVGGAFDLRLFARDGSFAFLLLGQSLPGTAVPVPPFSGALETIVGIEVATPLLALPDGQVELGAPAPNQPALAGAVVELQAISFDDATFTTGSFSNLLTITLEP